MYVCQLLKRLHCANVIRLQKVLMWTIAISFRRFNSQAEWPDWASFRLLGYWLHTLESYLKNTEVAQILGHIYTWKKRRIYFKENILVGPERVWKVRAQVGFGIYTAGSGFCGPGLAWGRARGLACGLSPKTRPVRARVFGLCSKSPSPQCRSGPTFWALSSRTHLVTCSREKRQIHISVDLM
jgi:hypothetical protein